MAKRGKLSSLIIGALMLLPLLVSACGSGGSTVAGTSSGPQKGGSVTDGLLEEPDTLLPFLTNETYSFMVDEAIWAPLWLTNPQGQYQTGIAQSIPTSADLKSWTIKLKPNLKWSDGSALTAADLAFSLNLYSNPKFGNTFGFPTTDPSDPIGVASVTQVDAQTVTIVLRHPAVTFPSYLVFGASSVLPQEVFSKIPVADIPKSSENFKPSVTSGPFTISDRVQGDHITLTPNKNYYEAGKPYLSQLNFKIIQDSNTMLTALQSGTVDTSWFLDSTKLAAYRAIPNYVVSTDQYPAGYELLVFNECSQVGKNGCVKTSLLQDKAIRQALTMSLDVTSQSNGIIAKLYPGTAKPTCDDQSGTFAHNTNLVCDQYDPTKAGQILDQDGWTMGSDNYRHKNGQTLELTYATTSKATREQTQLIAQNEWKQIGIKIDIKNYPPPQYFGTQATAILHSGNYDIGEFANTPSTPDPDDHTFFMCAQTPDVGGSNYMRYCNPAVDTAENDQQGTSIQSKRLADFKTIEQSILDDAAVMYLFTPQNIAIHHNTLQNYNPSALGATETWNIQDWYLKAS